MWENHGQGAVMVIGVDESYKFSEICMNYLQWYDFENSIIFFFYSMQRKNGFIF